MSQFRLARISLILAALGLSAAPAFLTSAHAEEKPAAAAAANTLRPDMLKLLDGAKVDALVAAKNYDAVMANIVAAEAMPEPTPFEAYMISRTRLVLGVNTNNNDLIIPALESLIAGGRLAKKEQVNFIAAVADHYFALPDHVKAIAWFKRYQAESDSPERVRRKLSRSYYTLKDYPNAMIELDKLVAEAEAAGVAPELHDLTLRANVQFTLKDKVAYGQSLETLVKYYPKDEYWADLLHRLPNKPGYRPGLQLDVYRLQLMAQKAMAAEEYVEMAELALQGYYSTEAKAALDAGFANHVLGTGPDAAKHKQLRDQANKGAADDVKNSAADEVKARAGKNGQGMANLGYTFATMNQFDKGIDLIEKGIAKGGLKNPGDATLHMGVALVKAGKKDEAIKLFETLKGTDGTGDLARYWILFLKAPVAAPVAK
ncbi:MAG: tetratricopeptide repeat protein [Pseudomonadota bacterium]